jgi:hypothetical protein
MTDVVDFGEYKAKRAGRIVVGSAEGLSVPTHQVTIRCNSLRHGMSVLDSWLESGVHIVCPRVAFEVVPSELRATRQGRAERRIVVALSDVVPTTGLFKGFVGFLLAPFRWIWE